MNEKKNTTKKKEWHENMGVHGTFKMFCWWPGRSVVELANEFCAVEFCSWLPISRTTSAYCSIPIANVGLAVPQPVDTFFSSPESLSKHGQILTSNAWALTSQLKILQQRVGICLIFLSVCLMLAAFQDQRLSVVCLPWRKIPSAALSLHVFGADTFTSPLDGVGCMFKASVSSSYHICNSLGPKTSMEHLLHFWSWVVSF